MAHVSATAVRSNDSDNQPSKITNVSLGFTKHLFTSCNEHDHTPAIHEMPLPSSNEMRKTPSPASVEAALKQSPLLRLPAELRIHIYSLLVLPTSPTDLLPSFQKVHSSTQDYFDYDKKTPATDLPSPTDLPAPTLMIRTIDPDSYRRRYPDSEPLPTRSKYSVRCDRFRSACKSTTYHCVNLPRIEDHMAILRTNQQIHAECADLLYSSYTFDFDTHVEAIVPFFSDLTAFARGRVKSVRFVKRALAYEKEFDRAAAGIRLRKLELGIVAGRPGERGWDRVARYDADYFRQSRDGAEGMEWMQYLLQMRGLQELDVKAVVEHCPPTTNSSAMARYVRFSASVEGGFAEFLKGELLGSA
ncbi:hypothetical protein LTR35_016834 [Friedmanniomyces endolithicus]|uniref:Uncharacterized protein n=1 Tax=Friedmanniomyces endolithicus TaxID=329885 RepID=A0AAN6FG73_9PEZI|nr:hypothetical protein LTR35_016834 [Friedmanniomyces endolithicus]KAK0272654.1 hypothetical protein LTS00_016102 [Friedmanniomyces endolithicus]KAK0315947.1 hypothetical protein LTR82_012483 [Friedmanniomyces endolithicus]KAK0976396.1 hypothetical protein LTR54_016506 [Friedmanniomyces endolithicus]